MLLLLAALAPAYADEWADQPIEMKVNTDFTAYTLHQGDVRLGLFAQEVGLLDNVHVGTSAIELPLGIVNLHGKVDAIQTQPIDIAVDGGWTGRDLHSLGVPGTASVSTIGVTGSWIASPNCSIHLGPSWTIVSVNAATGVTDLAAGIATQIGGAELGSALTEELGDSGDVFAGANLTLAQAHMALDWRLNRRDSLILSGRSFLSMRARLGAGYVTPNEGVEVGAQARVKRSLAGQGYSAVAVSWQFNYLHWNVRIGIPLPIGVLWSTAIPDAFEVYYRF